MTRTPRRLVTVLALAALAPLPGEAILRRHDRPDDAYVALGRDHAGPIGHLDRRVESTLVDPRWVLTAAHAVESLGPFDAPYVRFGEVGYRVTKIVLHPDWQGWPTLTRVYDLALLKLDRPVAGVRPAPLYRWRDEAGQVVTLVGRGKAGDGFTGPVGEKGTIVRAATNQVDGVGPTILLLCFDEPPGGTDLEGVGGPGDSGGPAYLVRGGERYLAGVGSATTWSPRETTASYYGFFDVYVRVSAFRDWILGVIAADAPATVEWSTPVRFDPAAGWPGTPAGRLTEELFRAYGEGTVAALEAFYLRHGETEAARPPADRARTLHEATWQPLGPLEVFGVSEAGPNQVRVLVHSPREDAWRSFGVEASPQDPSRLDHLYMKLESPPKEEVWH